MGNRYIKRENGKEVVYEQGGFLDKKIGTLEKDDSFFSGSGDKVIKSEDIFDGSFGGIIGHVSAPDVFGNRAADTNGKEGNFTDSSYFFTNMPGGNYTFKERDGSIDTDSGSSSGYNSGGESSSYEGSSKLNNRGSNSKSNPSRNKSGLCLLGKLLVGAAIVGLAAYVLSESPPKGKK